MQALQAIKENKLVAVIRNMKEDDAIPIGEALLEGGVKIFEITAESPDFLTSIKRIKKNFGEEVTVGAGTILDPETAKSAIHAGSEFIFSPTINTETIRLTKRYGAISIPGAMTPTEILTAYEHGADLIKVFPANIVGPGFIKDVHGPLPHIPLMPTGGVDLGNIQEFLNHGAIAVGLGSSLVNTKVNIDKEELNRISERAKQFVEKANYL
ncbi:bifunctional 4-hydroxy-2-oxoglutarate aldolase/2-dehydro-3-deoxy-phosphogluconate aldolase [Virgibacillus halophilus]|uniref:bifunctional 4-hydroxy-2-oxoglutarate aldolase/2-dehydro-3-deoxy-phosphogluconate aldolase n=1 Tax=Tigheibacillus halophilus TaxID=361280 RepID=UPI00363C320A